MSHIALNTTKLLLWMASSSKDYAAFYALFLLCRNMGIAASPGAVFHVTVSSPATTESSSTENTYQRMAIIAKLATGRSHYILSTALIACFGSAERIAFQVRVNIFKLNFLLYMAAWTKSYQIGQLVCFEVAVKKAIRLYVMYRQARSVVTTVLARIFISFSRCYPLYFPVRSTVVRAAPTPSRVVLSCKYSRRPPFARTDTAAKVTFPNSTRRFLKNCTASIAIHFNSFAPEASAVSFLPLTITRKAAKRVFGQCNLVTFTPKHFLTLCTYNVYHTNIIPGMGININGDHLA